MRGSHQSVRLKIVDHRRRWGTGDEQGESLIKGIGTLNWPHPFDIAMGWADLGTTENILGPGRYAVSIRGTKTTQTASGLLGEFTEVC
jgi:hypothetical protein